MIKNKNFLPLIAVLALLNLLSPKDSHADGMVIPPPAHRVQETAQKAVIWHDGVTETLILSITFRGDTEDFGWIVPVPSKPEVKKMSDELFTALEELTLPKVPRYDIPLGIGGFEIAPEKSTVQIIETKRVDIYEITVLKSGTSEDLASWLEKNSYPYPKDTAYILDDYIDNNWYFVAVKVSTKALGSRTEQLLRDGHATPLKITFKSEKIIYPLKISSIISDYTTPLTFPPTPTQPVPPEQFEASPSIPNLQNEYLKIQKEPWEREPIYPIPRYPEPLPEETVTIVLYVFSDHKKTVPGFNIDYASFVRPEVIEKLAYDESQQPWMSPTKKMFLTKLTATKRPSEMTADLILREADDNKPVNARYLLDISGWRFAAIILIPLVIELTIIAYFILKRRK